ncbi:MAG TPA: hypothetical protein PKV48_06600 [Thermodesulfobacteriota bacterium]|mgnify:CR=1 FL=1|nr:hypothetical protein [Thermodesulfobacteriota bacterium]
MVNVDYTQGGSFINSPLDIPLVPPTPVDCIVSAVCQANIKACKAIFDTTGNYSRPDILSLTYHYTPYQEMVAAVRQVKRDQLERVGEKYDVSPEAIENAAERLVKVKFKR